MKKEMKGWPKCPRCDSHRVIRPDEGRVITWGVLLIIIGALVILLSHGLGIFIAMVGAAFLFGAFVRRNKLFCQDCHYTWTRKKSRETSPNSTP